MWLTGRDIEKFLEADIEKRQGQRNLPPEKMALYCIDRQLPDVCSCCCIVDMPSQSSRVSIFEASRFNSYIHSVVTVFEVGDLRSSRRCIQADEKNTTLYYLYRLKTTGYSGKKKESRTALERLKSTIIRSSTYRQYMFPRKGSNTVTL